MSPTERESETRKRLLVIEEHRRELRRIKSQRKELGAEKKDLEEQIDRALDEIKEIREGGAVQMSLDE